MKFLNFYIVLFILLLSSFAVNAQSRKQLETQRKKYQSEIKKLNKLLFNEQIKEKGALESLKDINKKIDVRNKLIETIDLEAKLLTKEIAASEKKQLKLNNNLKALKKDYADMIFKSYKSRSQQSRLMFLLSSDNFYQAYKRVQYIKQYTSYRKKQGEDIVVQTKYIEKMKDSLLYQKQVKDTLILSEENQKKEIEFDKKRQESLLATIKKKEGKYKRELRKSINEEKKVTAKIDKLIRDEIEKANRLARKEMNAKTPEKRDNKFILSPEAKALAARFEQNKGKLPWPVKESVTVRRFGKQPHPRFPGITINGTGLHLVTAKDSDAEAIFNGEVLNVLVSSGGIKNVLIRHGNYITSYNNLESSYVKKGDKIITGQKIGKIFTDKLEGTTKLIFVLFNNTTRLNPASWMLKR